LLTVALFSMRDSNNLENQAGNRNEGSIEQLRLDIAAEYGKRATAGKTNMLIAGLGGGLDVVNATSMYFMAKAQGIDATLGSIKSQSIEQIVGGTRVHDSAAWIHPDSSFADLGPRRRYCEAQLARVLGESILYFGQRVGDGYNIGSLRGAIKRAAQQYGFTHMLFVDCGGDSLTFLPSDATEYSGTSDPFVGGDARSLEALSGVANAHLGVAAMGLDVDKSGAQANLRYLSIRNQTLGKLDLRFGESGETREYRFPIDFNAQGIQEYLNVVESIVKLKPEDEHDSKKFVSLTAPVLYHAIRGNYGPQYTAARWAQGQSGTVDVELSYAQMHIMCADKLHDIKSEINRRSQQRAKIPAAEADEEENRGGIK